MNDVALVQAPAFTPVDAAPRPERVLPSAGVLIRFAVSSTPFHIPTSERGGGIYLILNPISGKYYIGKARSLRTRQQGHLADLRGRRHHSEKLQRSVNKYGADKFVFYVLLREPDEKRRRRFEHALIKTTEAVRLGYNCTDTTPDGAGCGHGDAVSRARWAAWPGGRDAVIERIKLLLAMRTTTGEIARQLGCSSHGVWLLIKRFNIPKPTKREQISMRRLGQRSARVGPLLTTENKELVVAMARSGFWNTEIMQATKLPQHVIYGELKSRGVFDEWREARERRVELSHRAFYEQMSGRPYSEIVSDVRKMKLLGCGKSEIARKMHFHCPAHVDALLRRIKRKAPGIAPGA